VQTDGVNFDREESNQQEWKTNIVRKTLEDIQKHYTRSEVDKVPQSSSIGLIIRQKEPKVLETPLDRVDSFLTPNELFYVRSHSPAPKLGPASYRLQIDGAVRNPLALTCKELRDMPAETRVAI
jgi:DMSO/TMAO reductase YedYZ molybdopterin-dependent catalytic subunit